MQPKVTRRTERLIVRELGDDTIVYDLDNDQVHALSGAVAQVWNAADGGVAITALSEKAGVDEATAVAAVERLCEKNLLRTTLPAGLSRRQLMQRAGIVGGVALTLPAIETVMAPAAFAAQSNPPGYDMLAYFLGYAAGHTSAAGTTVHGTPPFSYYTGSMSSGVFSTRTEMSFYTAPKAGDPGRFSTLSSGNAPAFGLASTKDSVLVVPNNNLIFAIAFTPLTAVRTTTLSVSASGAPTTAKLQFFDITGTAVGSSVTLTSGSGSNSYTTATGSTNILYAALTLTAAASSNINMELIALN
jgi:hypothetical protein